MFQPASLFSTPTGWDTGRELPPGSRQSAVVPPRQTAALWGPGQLVHAPMVLPPFLLGAVCPGTPSSSPAHTPPP